MQIMRLLWQQVPAPCQRLLEMKAQNQLNQNYINRIMPLFSKSLLRLPSISRSNGKSESRKDCERLVLTKLIHSSSKTGPQEQLQLTSSNLVFKVVLPAKILKRMLTFSTIVRTLCKHTVQLTSMAHPIKSLRTVKVTDRPKIKIKDRLGEALVCRSRVAKRQEFRPLMHKQAGLSTH